MFVCLVTAMLVMTPTGSADAGIGQPVSLGPPQVFPTGSGPYAITAHAGVLAVVNNVSNNLSVVQRSTVTGGLDTVTHYPLPTGALPQAVAGGTRVTDFTVQDFLVVADTGINKVSVLLRQSSNTFLAPVEYVVGSAPHDVAVGNLTTDNNPDIVTANFGSNNITVLPGLANGTFGNAVSFATSPKPRAVAVGPIDNIFVTDIVTCSSDGGAGKVNVFFGIGGTFQPSGTYNVGSDPHDIALGDFNLDGKQDIVTANTGSNNVTVLLNDGAGGFPVSNPYAAGLSPRSIAVTDFNLDGKPDLALASAASGLNLLLNNGDGSFAPPVNFAMGQNPFGVAAGHFNSDGLIDVATANNGDGTISVRLNQTVPLLTFATPTPLPVISKPRSIAAFSRFGKPALAVTNNDSNNSRVSVLYGVKSFSGDYVGNFGAPTNYPLISGSIAEQVVVGNLGQIGLPSLVVTIPNANRVAILLGNSDDAFQPPFFKEVGLFPRSLTLADFNSDGTLDIGTANRESGTISILTGNADRTFQNAFTVPAVLTAEPQFIVSGDFNADGKSDLATCNSGPPEHNKVNVLLGNGNGTFQPINVYAVGLNPTFMTTGDLNNDGKLDLAVSNSDDNKVSVLLNNGSGVFLSASHYAVGLHPNSISVGDFNLDGKTDLVVTNGHSKTFSVLLNNGDGTFKSSLSFIVGQGPMGIAVVDLNFDNKPDVATANHDDSTISLVLNSTLAPPLPSPHNDNFANAETLNGISGQTLGTNVGATNEASDSGSSSVWYSWTAPADGGMTIDTFESSFNTLLTVYSGTTLANRVFVAQNDNDFSTAGDVRQTSKVKFTAVSGTTYKISVSSASFNNTGNITLNWSLLPPPSNDNFASSEILTGASGVIIRTNAGATKESGEPNHADNPGGGSIWFRWTAPANGNVVFNTSSSRIGCTLGVGNCRYDTLLAVYKGSTLQQVSDPLNLVAKNDNETSEHISSMVSFVATAGTTYQVAVDSKGGAKSDVVLSWFSGAAFNDSFANAVTISGQSGNGGSVVGPNGQAWFRWVAPGSGSATFESAIFRSPQRPTFHYPSTLSIHSVSSQNVLSLTGSDTGSCQVVFADRACNRSSVTFNAVGQTVYAVQINRPLEATGDASLSWTLSGGTPIVPANDNLAAARVISGFRGAVSFDNTNATKELNEPNHGGNPGGHSVWFNWTSPGSFHVTFLAQFSGQTISHAAYTGSTMAGLSPVAGGSSATFNAVQGTTYRIALDSPSTGFGSLSWQPTGLPSNDNFVNAQVINGSAGKVVATNINATREDGEPSHAGSSPFSSIWYSWTAPSNGPFTFNTDGSDVNTRLAVYSGTAVNNLSEVVANNNESTLISTSRVTFFGLEGKVYKIAIDGSEGTIRLQWGAPRSIGGRVTNIRGVGIANVTLSLSGDGARTRSTDAQGLYSFPDVPEGGTYTVTPSKASYGYDLESRTYNSLTSNVTDANFAATTPAYNIAGRISVGGNPRPNITVNLTGTAARSVVTNAQGAYEFSNLPTDGNYTVTPSSQFFTFRGAGGVNAYFFPALNENKAGVNFSATATAPPLELLLEESVPNSQSSALDALTLLRDPFPVVNLTNLLFSQDQNTRILLFVRNLQLAQGETPADIKVHLVDSLGQIHEVQAESWQLVPGVDFGQLTFRLPNLLVPGDYTIDVRVHGQISNPATIRIRL